jgi:hypothetical protein
MADEKLNVGINFNVTGNADAAEALNALGAVAKETAVAFDEAAASAKAMGASVTLDQAAVTAAQDAHAAILAGFGQVEPPVPLALQSPEIYAAGATSGAAAESAAQTEAAVAAHEALSVALTSQAEAASVLVTADEAMLAATSAVTEIEGTAAASAAAIAEADAAAAAASGELLAARRALADTEAAVATAQERSAAAQVAATAEMRQGTVAAEQLAGAETEAALAAKAMADAVTGAALLSKLGIKASAVGVVDESGAGLITVADEEQAAAQNILNSAKLEAIAVTKAQAAATMEAVAASRAAATANVAEAETSGAVVAGSLSIAAAARERLAAARAAGLAEGEMAINIRAQQEARAASMGAIEQEATGAGSALGGMWTQLIAVIAALEAYAKAKEFIHAGVDFNATIESAKLGIAASVNAVGELTDAQGRALEGQEKFGAATAIADDQIQKLYADSARTSTTVQQLVTTYQSAIAAGIHAGATLDQVRQLTTDAALAAGALNIPYSQLSVTLVQLLEGHTRITNRLSQELGITQADLHEWKEKGILVEKLLETFGQYETLGTRVQGTWRGVMSNVTEFFQQFSGAATSGAFTTLETGIKGQLARVFDFDTGKLTSNVEGAAHLLREGLGGGAQLVVDLVGKIIDGLERMGVWFENNKVKAEQLGRGFLDIVTSTGRIIAGVTEIAVKIAVWAASSVALQATLRAIGDIIGFIADHIGVVVAGVGAIVALLNYSSINLGAASIAAFFAAFNPITLVIATLVALTAAVEYHRITQERATAAAIAARQATIDHASATATLVGHYEALSKELESGRLKGEALTRAKAELKTVTDELVKISPAYREAISQETDGIRQQGEAVNALYESQLRQLEAQRDAAHASVDSLKGQESSLKNEQQDAIAAQGRPTTEGGAAIADAHLAQVNARLSEVRTQMKAAVADARAYGTAVDHAVSAKIRAEQDALAEVKPKHTDDEDKPVKGLDAAEANAAIERMNAQAATIERALQGQLQRNEISYADYFAKLNAVELSALDVQIAEKQQLLAKTTDPKQQAKLGADIEKLEEQETQVVEKNAAKRLQLEQQYERQRTALTVQAMKERGQTEEAFEIEFNQKHKAEADRARAENDQATLANIDYLHDAELARMRADRAATEARGVSSATEGTVRGTQAAVENGALSEPEGRQRIIAAYQQERDAILAAMSAAQTLAQIAPSPDNLAKVDALAKQYGTVTKEIARAADTSLHLREAITRSVSGDIAHGLVDMAQHVHNVGDAFRGLAQTVLKSLQDIIAKILEAAIASKVSGFLNMILGAGGGGSSLGSIGIPMGLGSMFADGGHVRGPGTSTSDSIPAMLSHGEYVVRASAVDRLGVNFFDAINTGRMQAHAYGGAVRVPGFAEGGHVGFARGGVVESGGAGGGGHHHIKLSLAHGLILDEMSSPAGAKVVVEHMQQNPKAVKQSLRLPATTHRNG